MIFKLFFAGVVFIDSQRARLNYFLVKVFNDILRIEEDALRVGEFKNLSVREMHVIEAVCNANDDGKHNRSADIAGVLRISAGTLTTSVSLLVKKGCLLRRQDEYDKRIVRLYATEKGRRANALHQQFHQAMVSGVIDELSDDELDGLIRGLERLQAFFEKDK